MPTGGPPASAGGERLVQHRGELERAVAARGKQPEMCRVGERAHLVRHRGPPLGEERLELGQPRVGHRRVQPEPERLRER
jgi:hypothetical protein